MPPLSLLSFGVSLYLRRASWLNPVKDVLRALRYHLRDPVPLQLVEHPGNVLRVACVSISVSCNCDTWCPFGATAPVEREPSLGEERPDWIDENTCVVDPFED